MFSKKLSANTFLLMMLLVGLVVFTACADTGTDEPAVVVEEPGMVEDESLVEEPLAEEGQDTLTEEPLAEEEGVIEDEPLVEEGQDTLTEEPLAEEEGLQEGMTGEDESLAQEGAVEEEPLAQEGVEEGVMGQEQAMGMEAQFPIRASELTGKNIMTQANEDLGQVEDVVIGLNNNVDYAIVSFGDQGFLDLGDEGAMIAVPLSALQPAAEEDAFYFVGETSVLQTAPQFTEDQWGNLADATWDDEFFDFWQQEQELALMPETGGEAAAAGAPAFVRASELMDQDVTNTAGEDIGNIEDIVLWPQPNQADYAIVSISEGLFDIGADERIAVPLNQINVTTVADTGDTTFTFDADPAMLEQAPRFTDDTIDLTNPAWDDEFNNYWGIPDATAGIGGPVMPDRRAFYGESDLLTAEDQFPIQLSELMGDDVMTRADEDLGQVDDVILGLNGNPHYLVVEEEGGFLGLGAGEAVIIPLAALEPVAEEDAFYFSGDATMFEAAPRFTDDMWDTIGTPGWEDQFHTFWRDQSVFADMDSGQDQAMTQETTTAAASYMRGSELLDIDILNSAGDDIGDVEDIMLTPFGTDFVLLSFDEGFGADVSILEDEIVPVPLDQLSFTADNVFNLNFDPMRLSEAPRFTRDEWDMFDPANWDNDSYTNFWGQESVVD